MQIHALLERVITTILTRSPFGTPESVCLYSTASVSLIGAEEVLLSPQVQATLLRASCHLRLSENNHSLNFCAGWSELRTSVPDRKAQHWQPSLYVFTSNAAHCEHVVRVILEARYPLKASRCL